VDVFGHDQLADQREFPARPQLAQNLQKAISGTPRAEKRLASITAERDEVQVPVTVVAHQRIAKGPNTR